MILFLAACAGDPADTGKGPGEEDTGDTGGDTDTVDTVDRVPCTPWLPWDVAGATWSYAVEDGGVVQRFTALGLVEWENGADYALRSEYLVDGEVTYSILGYYACTAEGLASVGSEFEQDGLRYVTEIAPPALWLPSELTVGTTWSAESDAAMDVYDADGNVVDRQPGFVGWEATVTGEGEASVRAGTFSTMEVDFSGDTVAYAFGVGLVEVVGQAGLTEYAVP